MKNKREEYNKVCPQCLDDFYANHLSRKFCSQDCKVIFNNRKTKDEYEHLKEHLRRIKNSVSILELHYLCNEFELTSDTLIKEGFDFNAYTDKRKIPGIELSTLHFGKFVLKRIKENTFKLSKR